jgi:2-aminoadipate transaminase
MAVISLARGVPSADLLPVRAIADAAQRALEHDPAGALAYGAPEGYRPLREWFARRYDVPVDRVLLTNGSLQGVALVIEHLFARAGGLAVVEAPTYDRSILLFKRFGAHVEALPLAADVIPNFQNPAGVTTSRAKRERLVALSAEHGFLILEDDPYRDVRFAGTDEPTMLSMDRHERVLYATSLTKTVAPGVRVGALVLPSAMWGAVRQLANDTFIAPGHLAQVTVAEYVGAGSYDPGVAHVRARLRERRDAMIAALDRTLGDRVRYVTPEGGYFLWIRLPGIDTDRLAAAADQAGVPVVKGSSCYPDDRGRDELRLAFSGVTPDEITQAVERLAALVR